jgi:hypothetical protein
MAEDETTQTPPETPPAASPPPVVERGKKPAIGLKYRGDGSQFFVGVPRRDLTVPQLLDLMPKQVVNITAGGVYELTKAGETALAAKEKAQHGD